MSDFKPVSIIRVMSGSAGPEHGPINWIRPSTKDPSPLCIWPQICVCVLSSCPVCSEDLDGRSCDSPTSAFRAIASDCMKMWESGGGGLGWVVCAGWRNLFLYLVLFVGKFHVQPISIRKIKFG